MQLLLYGAMKLLPLAQRGKDVVIEGWGEFRTRDGTIGIVPRNGDRTTVTVVTVTPAEYQILLAAYNQPPVELTGHDLGHLFRWRQKPDGSTFLRRPEADNDSSTIPFGSISSSGRAASTSGRSTYSFSVQAIPRTRT